MKYPYVTSLFILNPFSLRVTSFLAYPWSSVAPELVDVDALRVVRNSEEGEDEDDAEDGPDEVSDGDDSGISELKKHWEYLTKLF